MIRDFFSIKKVTDDPFDEDSKAERDKRLRRIIIVSLAGILFISGLIITVVNGVRNRNRDEELRLARETMVTTEATTYSDEEKESIQEAFNIALATEAENTLKAVTDSKVFDIAVTGVSRGVDFAKRIFRGDYINGYKAETDMYEFSVPLGFELARVVKVVDGDTISVEILGSNNERSDLFTMSPEELKQYFPYIRFLNINTAESVAPEEYLEKTGKENTDEGKEASAFLKQHVKEGDIVYLSPDPGEGSTDQDKYGRYIRLVWTQTDPERLDPLDEEAIREGTLNALMIVEGMADTLFAGDNEFYHSFFDGLKKIAMQNEKGFWKMHTEESNK